MQLVSLTALSCIRNLRLTSATVRVLGNSIVCCNHVASIDTTHHNTAIYVYRIWVWFSDDAASGTTPELDGLKQELLKAQEDLASAKEALRAKGGL